MTSQPTPLQHLQRMFNVELRFIRESHARASGAAVLMTCTLNLTARATRRTIVQPFAEVLRFQDGRLRHGTPFYFDTCEMLAALADK